MMMIIILSLLAVAVAPVPNAFTVLMQQIGSGTHVASAVEMAAGIAQEKYPKELMESLGNVAAKTKNPCHYERALHRWFRRQAFQELMPPAYTFPLTVYGKTKLSMKRITHSCILPHEWFGILYKFPELFQELMTGGTANLKHFWEQSRETDWYKALPVIGLDANPHETLIPIGHHGDDVGVYGLEKVLVMTWGSVATGLTTLDSRLVFTGVYVKQLVEDVTLNAIHKVFAWSLRCLANGVYPAQDHTGKAFSAEHHPHRFKLATQEDPRIAGGMLGVWAEMRGDWKYLAEALGLAASFATAAKLCHLCQANKHKRRLYYTKTRRDAWSLRRTKLSHRAFVRFQEAKPGHTTGPLYTIPGFHIWRVWVDILHSLDIGILQKLSASTLIELTQKKWQPYTAGNAKTRLLMAHREYCSWCKTNHCDAAPPFDASKWYAKGPYPQLSMKSAKGAQLRAMQYWFFERCDEELRRVPDVHNAIRREMWLSLVRFDVVCRHRLSDQTHPCAGRFLTAAEANRLGEHMEAALDCYNWLAKDAHERDLKLWKLQPQMHMLTHLAYDMAKEVNPRRVHCYADEDMVGRFKKLVNACHPLTAGTKSVLRYMIMISWRWWLMLADKRGVLEFVLGEAHAH